MNVLLWWLLPILATLCAIAWLWWQGRTGAEEPGQVRSTKELERMRKAMEKPLPRKADGSPSVRPPDTDEVVPTDTTPGAT